MKKAILYGTLCLSVNASAQDTTYFAQDFDDWEDRNFRTWSQHNDSTVTTDNKGPAPRQIQSYSGWTGEKRHSRRNLRLECH